MEGGRVREGGISGMYLMNLATSSGLRTDSLCLSPNSAQLFSSNPSPGFSRAAEGKGGEEEEDGEEVVNIPPPSCKYPLTISIVCVRRKYSEHV